MLIHIKRDVNARETACGGEAWTACAVLRENIGKEGHGRPTCPECLAAEDLPPVAPGGHAVLLTPDGKVVDSWGKFDRKPQSLPIPTETKACGECGTCANCLHNARLAAEKEVAYLREQLAAADLDAKDVKTKLAAQTAARSTAEEKVDNLRGIVFRLNGRIEAQSEVITTLIDRIAEK